jgi:uncharacterized protein YdaU (DUF1376 family)
LESNLQSCKPPLSVSESVSIADSVCQHPPETRSNKSSKRLEKCYLNWFKFNNRDFFTDQNIVQMTDAQIGWWICLMAHAWNAGGFLPADLDALQKLARARSKAAFMKGYKLVLSAFEIVDIDGQVRLKHPEMAAEHAKALKSYMNKKNGGDSSNAARLLRNKGRR